MSGYTPLSEFQESDCHEWLVTWADGTERTTTLAPIAWYGDNFDEEASVDEL